MGGMVLYLSRYLQGNRSCDLITAVATDVGHGVDIMMEVQEIGSYLGLGLCVALQSQYGFLWSK